MTVCPRLHVLPMILMMMICDVDDADADADE